MAFEVNFGYVNQTFAIHISHIKIELLEHLTYIFGWTMDILPREFNTCKDCIL